LNCNKHGVVPCYVVCPHVVAGEAVPFAVAHPDENPGLIVCCECDKLARPLKSAVEFAPVCVYCATEQGWTVAAQ